MKIDEAAQPLGLRQSPRYLVSRVVRGFRHETFGGGVDVVSWTV